MGPCGLCWWVLAGAMVLLGDAGLGRDHRSTRYNVLFDDGFLCRRVSPRGWCWWVDWCVLLTDVCWGVLVGLLGMASQATRFFCLRPHYTFFLVPVSYQIYCIRDLSFIKSRGGRGNFPYLRYFFLFSVFYFCNF